MTHRIIPLTSLLALCAVATSPLAAHDGKLDANGCHYDRSNGGYHCHKDVPPNLDRNAPAKKSRDNICHDARSPDYRMLRYFISYRSMDQCLASGGRESF